MHATRRKVVAARLGEVVIARCGIRYPAGGIEDGFLVDLLGVHARFFPGHITGHL